MTYQCLLQARLPSPAVIHVTARSEVKKWTRTSWLRGAKAITKALSHRKTRFRLLCLCVFVVKFCGCLRKANPLLRQQ